VTAQAILNMDGLIAALGLPCSCSVDQRVPKKLLVENGAPTASDKRLIADAIEEIQWIAALKPNTIGVSDFRDEKREYLEIAVLAVTLRTKDAKPANAARLAELVHRAVPYPIFLLLKSGHHMTLSLAHKRWAQNEADKVVLDGGVVSVTLPDDVPSEYALSAFTQALSLANQPQTTLLSLYQGWINSVQAMQSAKLTGTFKTVDTPEQAMARRQVLQDVQRLELEEARLRAHAAKEKQLARLVEINLALQRVQALLAATREQL